MEEIYRLPAKAQRFIAYLALKTLIETGLCCCYLGLLEILMEILSKSF